MAEGQAIHPLMRQFPQFFSASFPGFNTYRGWDGILAIMLWRLAQLPLPSNFKLLQVKEMFGKLRVYTNGNYGQCPRQVRSILNSAESVSGSTCEYCGALEATTQEDRGQVRTLCGECAAEWRARVEKE